MFLFNFFGIKPTLTKRNTTLINAGNMCNGNKKRPSPKLVITMAIFFLIFPYVVSRGQCVQRYVKLFLSPLDMPFGSKSEHDSITPTKRPPNLLFDPSRDSPRWRPPSQSSDWTRRTLPFFPCLWPEWMRYFDGSEQVLTEAVDCRQTKL